MWPFEGHHDADVALSEKEFDSPDEDGIMKETIIETNYATNDEFISAVS